MVGVLLNWSNHFIDEQVMSNDLQSKADQMGSTPFRRIEEGIVLFVCEGMLQVHILFRNIRFAMDQDFTTSGKHWPLKVFASLLT